MLRQTDNKTLITAGIMAVVIVLFTALLRVDLNILRNGQHAGAYLSLGDVGLYVAILLLGGPWAALCAAVGSALGALFIGSAVYAPANLIFKPLMVFTAVALLKRDSTWMGVFKAVGLASAVMILGGFLYDLVILASYEVAALRLPYNLIEAVVCALISIPVLKLLGGKSYSQTGDTMTSSSTTTKRQLK